MAEVILPNFVSKSENVLHLSPGSLGIHVLCETSCHVENPATWEMHNRLHIGISDDVPVKGQSTTSINCQL